MIQGFQGEYRFLSNFWYAEIILPYSITAFNKDDTFKAHTNEHAYQACKALTFLGFTTVLHCDTPGKAKRMGKSITIRDNWNNYRTNTMYLINVAKYTQHRELRKKLLATDNQEIQEVNHWNDQFWGICNGKGENNLGKILMQIREELK